jgi:hypothetical protein
MVRGNVVVVVNPFGKFADVRVGVADVFVVAPT